MADPDRYLALARSLAEGRGLSFQGRATAYRPPLYPIALAPIVAVLGDRAGLGIAAFHLGLGAATAILTAWAARLGGLGDRRSWAAGFIVALDPVLVAQSRSAMTETLAAALTAASLAALASPRRSAPIVGGVGLGLGVLCRPSALPGALLVAIAWILVGPGVRLRDRAGQAILLALTLGATLAPWAWRNARVLGEPVWTTTHGGYTLALANNPEYYRDVLAGAPGAVWSGPNQDLWWARVGSQTAAMSEPDADRFLRGEGWRMLRERPTSFARAGLARLARFWGLAPSGLVYPKPLRMVTAAWTVPFWALAAVGAWRARRHPWPIAVAGALAAGLCGVHVFYWSDMRMRSPIVPALAVLAANGLPGRRREGPGWGPAVALEKTRFLGTPAVPGMESCYAGRNRSRRVLLSR